MCAPMVERGGEVGGCASVCVDVQERVRVSVCRCGCPFECVCVYV